MTTLRTLLKYLLTFYGTAFVLLAALAPFFEMNQWTKLDLYSRTFASAFFFVAFRKSIFQKETYNLKSSFHKIFTQKTTETLFVFTFLGCALLLPYKEFFNLFPEASKLANKFPSLDNFTLWTLIIVNGFFTPLVEEVFWRGVFWEHASKKLPLLVHITLGSSFFAASHFLVDGSFARFIPVLLLGFVFSLVRLKFGLSGSVGLHIGINTAASSTLLFQDKLSLLFPNAFMG
jgi:membrane protease YdiL (CAAX protease family)